MVKMVIMLILPIVVLMANTYKIVEPDVISEAESHKSQFMKKAQAEEKKADDRIAKINGATLIKSSKTYTYFVNPTYTLQQDIPRVDRNGKQIGVLYPKGYTFNPLQYTRIAPPPIIAFNACDKKEFTLVKQLIINRPDAMLASSGCEVSKFPKDVDRQIYIVTDEMKEKFRLKYTISVVTANLQAQRIQVDVYKTTN